MAGDRKLCFNFAAGNRKKHKIPIMSRPTSVLEGLDTVKKAIMFFMRHK